MGRRRRARAGVVPFLLLLCLVVALLASPASAQESDDELDLEAAIELLDIQTFTIPHLDAEGEVDGQLDEAWWTEAPKVEIKLETYPALLEPAPVSTVARVARVGNSLWVAFEAADPEPHEILAPFRTRDGIDLDDYVALEIDTSGTAIRSYVFKVSARGYRGDEIRNRMSGARLRDWDANWEAAAADTEAGWTVEMRIPLSEMQIPTGEGIKRTMTFKRHYPRVIRHHLTALAIVIPVAEPPEVETRWLAAPVVTGQSERERDVEEETPFGTEDESALGIDFEYRPGPAFRLLGTVNPNYLEVETDLNRASVNDPFTPLQPERRRFFLAEKEAFDTLNNLVYTRNIEEPRVGLKFGRQAGSLTQGAFLVDDRRLRLIVPGNLASESEELDNDSFSAALRNRWDLSRDRALGLILTGRADRDDYHNVVAGFDLYSKVGLRNEFGTG